MLYGPIRSKQLAFRHSSLTRFPPVPPLSVAGCVVKPLGQYVSAICPFAQMWSKQFSLLDGHAYYPQNDRCFCIPKQRQNLLRTDPILVVFSLLIAQDLQGCKQEKSSLSRECHHIKCASGKSMKGGGEPPAFAYSRELFDAIEKVSSSSKRPKEACSTSREKTANTASIFSQAPNSSAVLLRYFPMLNGFCHRSVFGEAKDSNRDFQTKRSARPSFRMPHALFRFQFVCGPICSRTASRNVSAALENT